MRPSVYQQNYKDMKVMADCRIHDEVMNLLTEYSREAKTLLDIACGQGALSQRVKDNYPHIEIDVNDLDVGKVKFTDYHNKTGYDLNEPAEFSSKYDIITAIEIAEHIDSPQRLLMNMRSCLNKNGKIILSTPDTTSIFDRISYLLNGRLLYFTEYHYNDSGHITPIAKWQMCVFCERAGLKVAKIIRLKWQIRKISKLFRIMPILPLLPLIRDFHQTAINVYVLEVDLKGKTANE